MRGDARVCLLDLEVNRRAISRAHRQGGQLQMVLSRVLERWAKWVKGGSKEVLMPFGSVKMERSGRKKARGEERTF